MRRPRAPRLPLAMAQSVTVVARRKASWPSTGPSPQGEPSRPPARGNGIVGGLQAALRLLVASSRSGRRRHQGRRPSQAAFISARNVRRSGTGLSQVRLPDDAIDSVTVLPNPYAVEYGGFSSASCSSDARAAIMETRLNFSIPHSDQTARAGEDHRHSSFAPRLETGGPLIKDLLFLRSSQYRYRTSEVPAGRKRI